jgi:signal transduction histidine kinase
MSDTGPGVPKRAREHLFEAFQTVSRKGGSGLGLAIARELVQAHGGQILLVKNEGGATFRITIPHVIVEVERARQRRA